MQICVNKTQIQLVAGSQEHPEGKKKERDSWGQRYGCGFRGYLYGGPGRTSLRGATGESLLGDSPDFLSGSGRGTAQMHRQ